MPDATEQVAVFPLEVLAVMVAVPSAREAMTADLESIGFTDTIFGKLLDHVIVSLASAGVTVAISVAVVPILRVTAACEREIDSASLSFTVTLQLAVIPDLLPFIVTVVSPTATPVTTPLESTVAMLSLELVHVYVSDAA